jgi:hypothetical protein
VYAGTLLVVPDVICVPEPVEPLEPVTATAPSDLVVKFPPEALDRRGLATIVKRLVPVSPEEISSKVPLLEFSMCM